jgi:hypothetical protein
MSRMHPTLAEALEKSNATLVRQKKHLVYRLPNGRTFVLSKSPSDHRSVLNAVSTLRKLAA